MIRFYIHLFAGGVYAAMAWINIFHLDLINAALNAAASAIICFSYILEPKS